MSASGSIALRAAQIRTIQIENDLLERLAQLRLQIENDLLERLAQLRKARRGD